MQDRADRPPLQLLDFHVHVYWEFNDPLQHHDGRDIQTYRRNQRQRRALGALRKLTPHPRGQRFREKRSTEPRGDNAGTAQEVYQQFRKYGDLADPHAEELARLKTLIAEYEQSSHFTIGAVKFTGLAVERIK